MTARVRNASAVLSSIHYEPKKPVIAKKAITIQFPVRFKEIKLAQIGAENVVYGLFAMILDTGEWALCNVNAYVELGQAAIDIVNINGVEYYNFRFEAGQAVWKTTELVCRSEVIFTSLSEFILKGKMPWYIGYTDGSRLFKTSKRHAKTNANILPSVVQFMIAYCAREKSDRRMYYRQALNGKVKKPELAWVPMESVYWSAPTTLNRLAGAYFSDGVVSSIVNPTERASKIEEILRA